MAEQPNDYALIIGLNDYPDYGSEGRSLQGARADAEAFAAWARDDDRGGGVANSHLVTLFSAPDGSAPDRRAVDMELSRLRKDSEKNGARRLYFYFSGHGQAKSTGDVALCLPHWSVDFRHAALSLTRYKEFIMDCTHFAEVMMFLDCCRIRKVDASGSGSELACAKPTATATTRRHMVAFASEFQNPAFEAELQAGESDEDGPLVRGHFTRGLLTGLWGAAADDSGGVPLRNLKAHLEKEVPRLADDAGHTQYPHVLDDFPEANQPVFGTATPVPAAPATITFTSARAGEIVLEDGNMDVVHRGPAESGPWTLDLGRGWHHLREVGSGAEKSFRCVPEEGAIDVEF